MSEIRSETKLLWSILLDLILFPFHLVMVVLGKKNASELFSPFFEIIEFLFEPRFTILVVISNIAIFLWVIIGGVTIDPYILKPSYLLTLNLFPFISAGFLHANVSHLVGNMAGIFVFGRVVERKLGVGKTALVYFGALILSSLFTALIHLIILRDDTGGLGASGALMGLIAAAILVDPFYLTYELIVPLPVMVVGWIAIFADIMGIINPTEDGIGHFAHLGGFLSIMALVFLLSVEDREKMKTGLMINIVSVVLVVVFLFLRPMIGI